MLHHPPPFKLATAQLQSQRKGECPPLQHPIVLARGGVKGTRLEAMDTNKIRGQGQPFRGQTLSRPRTQVQVLSKKKKVFTKIFQAISKKKGFYKNFSGNLHKKRFPKNFSSAPQNFNNSKNSAVLEPRTGQFSRT